ncbi:UxaA family hydrolase [Reyranella sp. CPCC 100927]|uniref:UxaA family hydrolase n=1 Tax=Reyranella sp. CPCC 100927 TaxID=2599616 RepID=UPI0015B3DCE2|nr:UxaA family hydrolase [Reyranella sp. CPCC 100927]
MAEGESRILQLAPGDNVAVAIREIEAGDVVKIHGREIPMPQTLQVGHKFAARRIEAGETIVKYGTPIGRATIDIAAGEHLHAQNTVDDVPKPKAAPRAAEADGQETHSPTDDQA